MGSINFDVVTGSVIVGLLVGLTGAGGGALMTPMLILLFGIKPSTAISSDLVATVLMRPFGAAVHLRRGTVHKPMVGWMALGSVPAAFLGAFLLHQMSNAKGATANVERALGAALLLGASAMLVRYIIDRRSANPRTGTLDSVRVRPVATVAIGIVGGLVVGLTSVGSGSLLIVMLMFLYPSLSASRMVGTDLTQAIPLTMAAAAGAMIFGHVEIPLTVSIAVGAVPAVLVGSLLSSRVGDRLLRPAIFLVILASGLKYAGLGTDALAASVGVAFVVVVVEMVRTSRRPAARSTDVAERRPVRVGAPSPT
ncbi:MAG TPA: sulfite exporter TauE/SafE family protein [Acidimicrobiales bacterium]|jgi:hypothetical protein|nr:sulfite exporter TauE/SafE family protein [Acidimicrobiales bacterium]